MVGNELIKWYVARNLLLLNDTQDILLVFNFSRECELDRCLLYVTCVVSNHLEYGIVDQFGFRFLLRTWLFSTLRQGRDGNGIWLGFL